MKATAGKADPGARERERAPLPGGAGRGADVIEAQHVSKMYSRGVYALRDLSLRIDKGEFVFLTGPSGAGKSTLLRLLLRQDVPTEGQLVVGGRNLAKLTPRQVQAYRRSLGFVFQDFKLLPNKTVLENVAFVPRVLGMAADAAAAPDVPGAEVGRPAAPHERVSAGAVGRRAAAHRDRARARQRSGDHPRRRADRQPRSRSVARNHEPVPRDQRARHDGARRHARSRADPARRPPHGDARSRAASWRSPRRARAAAISSPRRPRACWRGRQRGAALDADDRRRAVRARLLPDGQRQPAAARRRWSDAAELSVYLRDDATPEQIGSDRRAARRAAGSPSGAASSRRTTREREFAQDFPDLAAGAAALERNPFPASFEVRLKRGRARSHRAPIDNLATTLDGMGGVADVRYDRRWLSRLNAAIRFVRGVGLVIVLLLALACALTVANVVRLAAAARRDEIEIMQLVGAPLWLYPRAVRRRGDAAGRHRGASLPCSCSWRPLPLFARVTGPVVRRRSA